MAITAIAFMPKQVEAREIEMMVRNPVQRVRVNSWRAQPHGDAFNPAALFDGVTNVRAWHTNHGGDGTSHGQGNGILPSHLDNIPLTLAGTWSPTMDIDLGSQQAVTSITIWRNTNDVSQNHRHNIYSVNVLSHSSTAATWPNGERTYAGQIANPGDVNVPMEDINADFAATGWSAVAGATVAGLVPKGERALTQEITVTFAQPLNTRYIRLEIDGWNSNRDGFPDGAPDHIIITQLQVNLATPEYVPVPVRTPLGANLPARHRISSWHTPGTNHDYTAYTHLFDGNTTTFVHSNWGGDNGAGQEEAEWHYVDIDMGELVNNLTGIEVEGRHGGAGTIIGMQIFTHSERGGTFPNGERTYAAYRATPERHPAGSITQDDLDRDFAMTGWTPLTTVAITGLATANQGRHIEYNGQIVAVNFTAPVESRYFRIAVQTAKGGGAGDVGDVGGSLQLSQIRMISRTPIARFFLDQAWYIDNSTGENIWRPTLTPFRDGDTSMLPLAHIAAAVGGEPDWSQSTQTAKITLPGGKEVTAVIGERLYGEDGRFMGTAQLVNMDGQWRTFVPARFVIEELGLGVLWLGNTLAAFDIFDGPLN
jgi:hypothetical protein